MLRLEIDTTSFNAQLDSISGLIELAIQQGATDVLAVILGEIISEWTTVTGDTKSGWTDAPIIIKAGSFTTVFIENANEYARYVDSLNPAHEYVRRPDRTPPPYSGRFKIWADARGLTEDEAYAAAQTIGLFGIENPFIAKGAYEENEDQFIIQIMKLLSKVLK